MAAGSAAALVLRDAALRAAPQDEGGLMLSFGEDAMKRFVLVILSLFTLAFSPSAHAQDKFPAKPIKVITAYGPGSATDIIIRILGEQLRQVLGQSVVVENKPGAFGIIAIEEMARARPDGYTLMIGNVSTNAITPVLFKSKFSIDYEKDVVPLARIADL